MPYRFRMREASILCLRLLSGQRVEDVQKKNLIRQIPTLLSGGTEVLKGWVLIMIRRGHGAAGKLN